MATLILLRHGQSLWNLQNRFTGWVDVDLSEQGIQEAQQAGEKLKNTKVDRLYTSVLMRAEKTAAIALECAGQSEVPKTRDAALNERHYGALQGLNKDETREKYGKEQVHQWRRSYSVNPPEGESLADTCERVLPYYRKEICPHLDAGETVLVAAHGNSLRALIKELEQLSEDEIVKVEVPTGVPLVYTLDASGKVTHKEIWD
ncbi:MAG: 2,3-bisphosphoglycerate-dependent phosphoglycerate mutase [Myxococcales bacterium]|nr:2,3-bisphosphoglycerate-dependent phosphoglycerate mutase [Myxococcales bacterium]